MTWLTSNNQDTSPVFLVIDVLDIFRRHKRKHYQKPKAGFYSLPMSGYCILSKFWVRQCGCHLTSHHSLKFLTHVVIPRTVGTIHGLPAQNIDPRFEQRNPWTVQIHALSIAYVCAYIYYNYIYIISIYNIHIIYKEWDRFARSLLAGAHDVNLVA